MNPEAKIPIPASGEVVETRACERCGSVVAPVVLPRSRFLSNSVIQPRFCSACVEREEAGEKSRERAEKAADLLAGANLPPEAAAWDMRTVTPRGDRVGLPAVKGWRPGPEGLYLYGPAGSGKTRLAWALAKRLITEKLVSVLVVSVPELLNEIKKSWRHSRTAKDWMERGQHVQVLVLDDIGAEKPTEWARETILSLIDYRINHRRPTIFTSNYSPEELWKRLGDEKGRVVSRIVGSCLLVEVKDRNFRLETSIERQKRFRLAQAEGGKD